MIHFRHFLLLSLTVILLTSCASGTTPEPAPVVQADSSPTPPPRPSATPAPLGTDENPLVLALPAARTVESARVQAGKDLAEELSALTGYTILVVAPETETKLVGALELGNAHIAMLSPYAYVLAYQKGAVRASFARLKSGEKAYGAQYIARTDAGFRSYFDAETGENIAEAAVALSQFQNQKPCWTDETSPSGYIIPAGILAHNEISTQSPAILGGHPPVVQAVYTGGICDFGATYIDARTFPLMKDKHPDVLEQVMVVWRIPPVIPYDVFVLNREMPPEMLESLEAAIFRISGMESGKKLFLAAYGTDELELTSDTYYAPYRTYVIASGVPLEELVD